MNNAKEYFLQSIDWLRGKFTTFNFFVERDVVWTVQECLIHYLKEDPALRVYNDYGILPGNRRRLSADIAIVDHNDEIILAAEFKFEPSHKRNDIPKEKFPVVVWGKEGVEKDIERIHRFVNEAGVEHAYSIFIDEGGYFKWREAHPGSEWIQWNSETWVLWAETHKKQTKE